MSDLLPGVIANISEVYKDRPDLVLASWPDVIGPKLSAMTQAVSFANGTLVVKVKNSTLYTLLSQNEKSHVLSILKDKFPRIEIKNILFRIG